MDHKLEQLKKQVRDSASLHDRLIQARAMIGKSARSTDEDFFISTTLQDAADYIEQAVKDSSSHLNAQ